MKFFGQVFAIEVKKLKKAEYIWSMILVLVVSLTFVKVGIDQYEGVMQEKDTFQKFEEKKVGKLPNYRDYAKEGHRIFFVPSMTSIFFTDSIISGSLIARVDAGERLEINQPLRGKKILSSSQGRLSGFSWLILLIGSMIALYYGSTAYRDKKYLAMLCSIAGRGRVIWSVFIARLILLSLYFALVSGASLLLTVINGIVPDAASMHFLLLFFACLILVMCVFFSFGTLIGMVGKKERSIFLLLALWIFLLFLVPKLLDVNLSQKMNKTKSLYEVEYDSLELVTKFEKRAVKEAGKYKEANRNTAILKKLANSFTLNEFSAIINLDEQLRLDCSDKINENRKISALSPVSLITNFADSVGSSGIENRLRLWVYSKNLKVGFAKYYLHKQYFTTESDVRSFVTADENIFYSKATVPPYLLLGILVSCFYLTASGAVLCIVFKRRYYRVSRDELKMVPEITPPETFKARVDVWIDQNHILERTVLAALMGGTQTLRRRGFDRTIRIYDMDIIADGSKSTILYICPPEQIPGHLKVKDFLKLVFAGSEIEKKEAETFMKKPGVTNSLEKLFKEVDSETKTHLLLDLLAIKQYDFYLVSELGLYWPEDKAVAIPQKLLKAAGNDGEVLYLTSDYIFLSGNPETTLRAPNNAFIREEVWQLEMKKTLRKLEIEAKKNRAPGQGKEKCDGRF